MSTGKYWVTEPHQELPPTIAKTGFASIPAVTVVEQFRATCAAHGNANALACQTKVDVIFFCFNIFTVYQIVFYSRLLIKNIYFVALWYPGRSF
jgi:hypothetical protein